MLDLHFKGNIFVLTIIINEFANLNPRDLIRLCLFAFQPIASKQLNSLTTINTFS